MRQSSGLKTQIRYKICCTNFIIYSFSERREIMKKALIISLVTTFVFGLFSCSTSKLSPEVQEYQKKLQEQVETQNYRFVANYAIPRGNFQPRYLTSEYDLKISKDTVEAFLPYYGVAYEAPVDLTGGGIKFTSKDFDYVLNHGKRPGNWIVNIRIKDQRREIILTLNIWENGDADLNVMNTSRQSIFFRGKIE